MKMIDLRTLSESEALELSSKIGSEMRVLIDKEISSLFKKTGKKVKFVFDIVSSKEKIEKPFRDQEEDVLKVQEKINKRLNKITKMYGLKTSLTLIKE